MRVDVNLKVAGVVAGIIATLLVALTLMPPDLARTLTRESGPIEDLSALGHLVGMIFAIAAARQVQGWLRVHLWLWAVLALLFFGEETSWLQHYLGYGTPEALEAINAQDEFNIHNLEALQGGSLREERLHAGLLLTSQNLFRLGFTTYFLLLPLAAAWRPVATLVQRFEVPTIGRNLVLMAWIPIVVSVALLIGADDVVDSALAETREMVYGITIGSFLGMVWWSLRQRTRADQRNGD